MSIPTRFQVLICLALTASGLQQAAAQAALDDPATAVATQDAAPELSIGLAQPEGPAAASNAVLAAAHLEQLREQQQYILRAIEQVRQEANAAARQNAESITGRLNTIEQSLSGERQRELEAIQKWNLLTLVVVGGFASLGFLALLLVAPFLIRALNRMSDVAATLRDHEPGRPALAAPQTKETALLASPEMARSTARFLEALERVERRIHQLENTVQSPPLSVEAHTNGGAKTIVSPESGFVPSADSPGRMLNPLARTDLLMEKGQGLLQAGDTEQALACFEEVIAAEPDIAEGYLKKGQALEKLKRTEEALASYDRAIALDKSVTTAYLCKGSLLNQLARYNEALQCYELALRVQEGAPAGH